MPVETNNDTKQTEPSRKRPRLSLGSYGNILTKRADNETSLEVDCLILDYLAWRATNNCFECSWTEHTLDPPRSTTVVEDFLKLFRDRYPDFHFDVEMRFRMLLLKVITLLTYRFARRQCSPALETLRTMRGHNKDRAARWIGSPERRPTFKHDTTLFEHCLPVSQDYLDQCRHRTLEELGFSAEAESYESSYYGSDECVSLLDVLPLFLQVCAVCRAIHDGNMTDHLMVLTKELMIKACLEQYLVFGAHGAEVIDQAFAWGFEPGERSRSDTDGLSKDDRQLNLLFADEDAATEFQGWAEARDTMVSLLFRHDLRQSDQHGAFVRHLESLDDQYSTVKVHQQSRDFLRQLSLSIDEPVLAQLEKGQLTDMTKAETQEFLRSCGPDVAKFFQPV